MKCACGCESDFVYLHSKCHVDAPTWAILRGRMLTIACAECDEPIVSFRVSKPVAPSVLSEAPSLPPEPTDRTT